MAALLLCAALARATDATDECASSLAIEDVERYKRDGYVIIRNLFSAAEADESGALVGDIVSVVGSPTRLMARRARPTCRSAHPIPCCSATVLP